MLVLLLLELSKKQVGSMQHEMSQILSKYLPFTLYFERRLF